MLRLYIFCFLMCLVIKCRDRTLRALEGVDVGVMSAISGPSLIDAVRALSALTTVQLVHCRH
jgi:hypothetical protein